MSTINAHVVDQVLGASIAMGAHNFYICVRVAMEKKTKLEVAQAIGSFFQLMNQICAVITFTQSATSFFGSNCRPFSDFASFNYFIFQLFSTAVLIYRATCLVANTHRKNMRIGYGVFFLIGYATVMYSVIMKKVKINGDSCSTSFDAPTNNAGKIIIAVLYIFLFITFLIPAMNHMKSARTGLATNYLFKVSRNVSSRIIFAILGYLISVVLSYAGVFGPYFQVQFTIQNYCAIIASTASFTTMANVTNDQSTNMKTNNGIHASKNLNDTNAKPKAVTSSNVLSQASKTENATSV
ncbi:hypothetical protein ROZALSC1DRAFT_30447 [Rozella allomycis CSF55]|uniref:G-protein coupled receptors family 1 profile domain-containing protein n=1 Tax=Rozella allomycis (strain CSF55) TaxID=988480 RepID=A0A075ANA1_ROZAC|nr:hypothetical protein O9G_000922 [Rozella allomycis CSF55]RKP17789.1 hypothetical protein ROZALSC1DRAFT_30447 [Rozella allomycis CSF55]|eukprot:EPZ31277.1 hypothetical protein O9G_000922 [Rozella allomycis CSF55]